MNTPRLTVVLIFLLAVTSAIDCDVFLPGEGALGEPCVDNKRCELGLICVAGEGRCRKADTDNIGIEWVQLTGDLFVMGRFLQGGGETNNLIRHEVNVAGFEMMKSEVTMEQYRGCVGLGVCTEAGSIHGGFGCTWELNDRYDHPITCVTWQQAVDFCTWLGGRLPSEAEWEYAARSGGKDNEYPWGDLDPSCALVVSSQGCGSEIPTGVVCDKPAGNTEQGLCNMAANVAEWTADWYHQSYQGAPVTSAPWIDPVASLRVVRGGSGSADLTGGREALTTTARDSRDPAQQMGDVGFRCARDQDPALPNKGAPGEPCYDGEICQPGAICNGGTSQCEAATSANIGLNWVSLTGGTYTMGSPNGVGNPDEHPEHPVTLGDFELSDTEVTVWQYRACLGLGGCTGPSLWSNDIKCNWLENGLRDHPINCVTWHHAREFCAWAGGRLPSESEWEYAARSGGQAITYPWGDQAADCTRAVMQNGCGTGTTAQVCSRPDGNSAQGLCDLAGNVFEWVEDWYHLDYNGAPDDGSAWTESDTAGRRVVRGGCWKPEAGDQPVDLQAATRKEHAHDEFHDATGFRCAR